MYENYLAHYGILGMRWGVRRYQNKDGSLTAEGRKHLGIESGKGNSPRHKPSSAKKQAKQRAANLEKARKARAEKKAHDEAKKNALERGTASDVLKFKSELTNNELINAYNRLNYEKMIKDIAAKDIKTGWDRISSLADKTQKISNLANKGIDLWNVIAKLNNSLTDNPMPVIGEKKDSTKKDSGEEKAKKKLVTEYISKYGNQDKILASVNDMSLSQLENALKRLESNPELRKSNKK